MVARNELLWDNRSNVLYAERVASASRHSLGCARKTHPWASAWAICPRENNWAHRLRPDRRTRMNLPNKLTVARFVLTIAFLAVMVARVKHHETAAPASVIGGGVRHALA